MDIAAHHRVISLVDFLSWEERQEERYEYDGFEPVLMNGGTVRHGILLQNLALEFGIRLRNSPHCFLGCTAKLVTGSRVRYPDGMILCGAADLDASFVTTPTALFEVTSPSSMRTDHDEKVAGYCGIATVTHYFILEQDEPRITLHERTTTGWQRRVLGAGDVLEVAGVSVPVAELYRNAG